MSWSRSFLRSLASRITASGLRTYSLPRALSESWSAWDGLRLVAALVAMLVATRAVSQPPRRAAQAASTAARRMRKLLAGPGSPGSRLLRGLHELHAAVLGTPLRRVVLLERLGGPEALGGEPPRLD